MEVSALVAIAVVVFTVIIWLRRGSGEKKQPGHSDKHVPGLAPSDSKLGNLDDMAKAGSLHHFLLGLHQKFGSIASFWWEDEWFVSIASPALFAQHKLPYDKPEKFARFWNKYLTPVSLMSLPEHRSRWRFNRYLHCMSHENILGFYSIFHQCFSDMLDKWSEIKPGQHMYLNDAFLIPTIKATTEALGGQVLDDTNNEFITDYLFVFKESEQRILGDIPAEDSEREHSYEKAIQHVHKYVRQLMAQRLETNPDGDELIIDVILSADMTEEEKLADMLALFLGGFHTISRALVWLVFLVAKHPEVQEKLLEEVNTKLGMEPITGDSMGKLIYARQVINEGLRISHLAPYLSRVSEKPLNLGGYTIPPNTPVLQAVSVVLDDPSVFENPKRFDPDRFSPERSKSIPKYAFEPFGFAGRRKCPGYRFAYAEVTIGFLEIIRRFKIKLRNENQEVTHEYGIVTSLKEDIWVTLEKRT